MKKRVLITGSSGMLGGDLAEVLASAFDVYGIARKKKHGQGAQFFEFCLTERARLEACLQDVRPDFVIHAAAFTKVDLCEDPRYQNEAKKVNVGVTEHLADICNRQAVPLIFFSTDYVFEGSQAEPYRETDPIQPISFYGQTKAWAEAALQKKSNQFIVFRVTWLYGENGNHFPRAILSQAAQKSEITVVADQWGRPTWTKDIALVLRELLTSRQNLFDRYNKQVFHIGNDGKTNWANYARTVLRVAGFDKVTVKDISSSELNRPARRPQNSVLNLGKASELLGIKMRPWEDALQEFLKSRE